jgi:hypothetical protein
MGENIFFAIMLDKGGWIWFNGSLMKRINRKNANMWWWPAE